MAAKLNSSIVRPFQYEMNSGEEETAPQNQLLQFIPDAKSENMLISYHHLLNYMINYRRAKLIVTNLSYSFLYFINGTYHFLSQCFRVFTIIPILSRYYLLPIKARC